MPCVGDHGGRVQPSAYAHREAVSPLLERYAHQRCRQSYPPRLLERLAPHGVHYLVCATIAEHCAHHAQRHADGCRRQRLILAVTVVMVSVFGLAAQPYEDHHHHVGQKVRQRVHRIGYHRSRTAHDAGDKLEYQQHHIDDAALDGHPVDGAHPLVGDHLFLLLRYCHDILHLRWPRR